MKFDRNLAQMLRSLPQFAGVRAYNFHVHKELGCFFNPSLCQVINSTGHQKITSFSLQGMLLVFFSTVLKNMDTFEKGNQTSSSGWKKEQNAWHVYTLYHIY